MSKSKPNVRILGVIMVLILVVICVYGAWSIFSGGNTDTTHIVPYDDAGMTTGKEFSDTANALYKLCFDQPEVLASTMSAYPLQLQEFGIILDDPITAPMEIEELLESEDGAVIQLAMLGMLKSLLEDTNTKFALDEWSGNVRMLYMEQLSPGSAKTPDDVYLEWGQTELENAKIFAMAIGDSPENREFAYFYLEGGFQRFVPTLETQ